MFVIKKRQKYDGQFVKKIVSCKKQIMKYNANKKKNENKEIKNTRHGKYLKKEIFVIILVSNGDVSFEVLSLNVLDQFILGFCHRVPNFNM